MIACDNDKNFGQVDTVQMELEGITTAYREWKALSSVTPIFCGCYFHGLGIERRSY
jgi:hypothetical protein